MFRSGMCALDLAKQTTLIMCNEEMNDVMKIAISLEESGLLPLAKQLKMKQRNKNADISVFY